YVEMVGKYTNGGKPYEIVSLRMVVLDSSGEILASGSGTISNIGAYQSKYFNVVTRHPADFASCEIQVESVLPYLASRN
ncbi:MAG: FxLYD domain-containing protein, partial [Candidatus Nitrosotenuis sp.]|nr:FxLYD domain-containing protein [Candidatus Nitrosotenuis sp.]